MMQRNAFLKAHLNVNWLRPESALWDSIASARLADFDFIAPALDLGSGNGIFSFITAGGSFTSDYDWYRNVNPEGFWANRDIFDVFCREPKRECVLKGPMYQIDCALDAKPNLLRQTRGLGFYRSCITADASGRLPFRDERFQTVFSNILYWLPSAESALREVHRVLECGGRAILCLQDPKFKELCASYRWRESGSEVLRLLNRGRDECSLWTISYREIVSLAGTIGFRIVAHSYYLSPLTLKIWDIGLRSLSPVLIRMVQNLNETDRASIKTEWIGILQPFLAELYELDMKSETEGGYHCVSLEKL